MSRKHFVLGQQYFIIKHLDEDLKFFEIETFVFRAEAGSDQDNTLAKRWLFQSAHSFAVKGPLTPSPHGKNEDFLAVGEDMIDDLLDLPALVLRLNDLDR